VQNVHPESESGTKIELDEEHAELLHQYATMKAAVEDLTDAMDSTKAKICKFMGDAELATVNGEVVCKWKSASRNSIDTKKLEADHPTLAQKYKKQSQYRTFTVTKEK
jgi:predicted phage-related endonuclease